MTYSDYVQIKSNQDKIVDELSDKLNSFPKGDYGLTPAIVRQSEEYKIANASFNREWKQLQDINSFGMKHFKHEIRKAHEERRKLIQK
jgi:hypothetical protein